VIDGVGVAASMLTVHPVVSVVSGFPLVSDTRVTLMPSTLDEPGAPTALNIICPTLTVPVGATRLVKLKAESGVEPLVKLPALVFGAPANSAALPPAIEAIVTTAGV
jgi:hypothetical protein